MAIPNCDTYNIMGNYTGRSIGRWGFDRQAVTGSGYSLIWLNVDGDEQCGTLEAN